jgi:NAD(P)-dependent dehydrogenase (short-subunit alcohol dehydrogenase family)
MDFGLNDKLALVTGSTAGIGRAVADTLLTEGARVIVNGRTAFKVDATVRWLNERHAGAEAAVASAGLTRSAVSQGASGPRVTGIVGDLATPEGADAVVRQVNTLGPLDVLVNNVGFFEVKPMAELADDDWLAMFQLNVMSSVRMAKAFLPGMLARDWGRIVFIASEQSAKPNPEMLHYAMTKAAQVSVARGLAELTKGTGVTVNSALVAPTWTEGVEVFLERVAEEAGTTVEGMRSEYFVSGDGTSSLLQRFARPEEIAAQVVFLCSTAASAVNGAAQRVDGGIVRSLF